MRCARIGVFSIMICEGKFLTSAAPTTSALMTLLTGGDFSNVTSSQAHCDKIWVSVDKNGKSGASETSPYIQIKNRTWHLFGYFERAKRHADESGMKTRGTRTLLMRNYGRQ